MTRRARRGGALLVLGQPGSRPLRWLTRSSYVALGRPHVLVRVLAGLVLRLRRQRRLN